jgi:hypothetical protein
VHVDWQYPLYCKYSKQDKKTKGWRKTQQKEETSSQFPKGDIGIKHKKVHDFVFN